MKTKKKLLYALPFLLFACNDEGKDDKDSVQIADSVNESSEEKANSTGAVISADTETADFLLSAADGGMAEVKLAELAKQKAAHAKVKGRGDMVSADQHRVNEEVKKLASERTVSLPATVGNDNQKDIDAMATKTGKDFDKAYVGYMIKDQEEDIALLKRTIDKVHDADVPTFANNTLPKLQEQLDLFKTVQKIIN
jgi:putative membrane protein